MAGEVCGRMRACLRGAECHLGRADMRSVLDRVMMVRSGGR